uniref:Uncharacterized protein n=1 Tax=Arundo donax TaxID=35708 RepID=A0A0A9G005_ARUDO
MFIFLYRATLTGTELFYFGLIHEYCLSHCID